MREDTTLITRRRTIPIGSTRGFPIDEPLGLAISISRRQSVWGTLNRYCEDAERTRGTRRSSDRRAAAVALVGPENRCIVPGDLILRVRARQAAQDAHLVRLERGTGRFFAFAGLWASRRGAGGLKSAPVEGRHEFSVSDG